MSCCREDMNLLRIIMMEKKRGNGPQKITVRIYSDSCVLELPVVRFGQKGPSRKHKWASQLECVLVCLRACGLVHVNRINVRMYVLCLALSWSHILTLHLVGHDFVLSSHSVGLRSAGLHLGLTVGLWLNSRLVRWLWFEMSVGFI